MGGRWRRRGEGAGRGAGGERLDFQVCRLNCRDNQKEKVGVQRAEWRKRWAGGKCVGGQDGAGQGGAAGGPPTYFESWKPAQTFFLFFGVHPPSPRTAFTLPSLLRPHLGVTRTKILARHLFKRQHLFDTPHLLAPPPDVRQDPRPSRHAG